jgi:bifunctional DNA-binding transcriptional regulator/antitoxin component of YhaV-PrlF toxin-antitoxin module
MLGCKAMSEVILSSKNKIVVPREARKAIQVKPGNKLLVVVRGEKVIVLQKPKSHHDAIRGLARGVYSGRKAVGRPEAPRRMIRAGTPKNYFYI